MDTENVEDKVEHFEKRTSEIYERLTSRKQSSIVLQYLLNLGKELDKDGFFIYCYADYALVEGGFLYCNENCELEGYKVRIRDSY
ncbi:MAG: hypothetical protein QGH83_11490 [Candidatus Pacebacteria bacterium]|jgi:predicted metal-binding protein|nr:hypothetical protein [Candidatus Paceibacterota bacterium]|tara:strand:+ start:787 stop:1041 length:255 start_codon:yes stop_codon:yes gene_type:complete